MVALKYHISGIADGYAILRKKNVLIKTDIYFN